MKTKFLSIVGSVCLLAGTMGFVSCSEEDEPKMPAELTLSTNEKSVTTDQLTYEFDVISGNGLSGRGCKQHGLFTGKSDCQRQPHNRRTG